MPTKPTHFTFNLNDVVRYKVTTRGLAIHRKNWDDLNAMAGGGLARISPYQPPTVDKEGWGEEQLWVLMREYGKGLGNGLDCPISMSVQIAAKDLAPVAPAKRERQQKTS
jgi:hypothetical protein